MKNCGTVWYCMKSKAIIFDLDGTLVCNPSWDGDLESFYKNIFEGFTVEWCQTLIECLQVRIIFITARSERCRRQTEQQLNMWFDKPYELYMRGKNDLRIDHEVKEDYLKEIMEKYQVLCCFDDNPENCKMFSKYIPTLQVVRQ